jgi:3',5'-cyclic AMP phosphodiesterase CpdA
MNRRELLKITAALAVPAAASSFKVVHATDFHIQPELQAADHCVRCAASINSTECDLVLAGGDLVFDANLVSESRTAALFRLYEETLKRVQKPVHAVIGNHDLFGIGQRAKGEPVRVKQAYSHWAQLYGNRFRHFQHKGWHFILLDSVQILDGGGYRGWIDPEQLSWLRGELSGIPQGAPIAVVTHIPLATAFLQHGDLEAAPANALVVENSREVCHLLFQHKVRLVLQGHTHMCEVVEHQGCKFITTGAVCGNWWKGPRMGAGYGFGLVEFQGDKFDYRFVEYPLA